MVRGFVVHVNFTFKRFINSFPVDEGEVSPFDGAGRLLQIEGLKPFFQNYAGCTFGGGIYRVLRGGEVEAWNEMVLGIFSQFKGTIECFATDWMGRVFAWDFNRNKIILLDPGFGEALKIPCNFIELHNQEFVDYPDDSLSQNLYAEYLERFKSTVSQDQCVGYKISPFLGGEDNLDNMEITDIKVYWSISSDIYNEVKAS